MIVNNRHILDDLNTNKRLPDSIKNSDIPLETLNGVIGKAIEKIKANYKLAVPHYYKIKFNYLFRYVLVKWKSRCCTGFGSTKNGNYLATTCLSMEMAYIDARLIARPESNWLMADHIIDNSSYDQEFIDDSNEAENE